MSSAATSTPPMLFARAGIARLAAHSRLAVANGRDPATNYLALSLQRRAGVQGRHPDARGPERHGQAPDGRVASEAVGDPDAQRERPAERVTQPDPYLTGPRRRVGAAEIAAE